MGLITTEPAARIARPGVFPIPGIPGASYRIGRDYVKDLGPLLRADAVAVDLEGRGKDGRRRYNLTSVQISNENEAWVFDPRDPSQYQMIKKVLSTQENLIFHNSTFDVHILYCNGLLSLDDIHKVWDTLITARLAHPDERASHGLTASAAMYLGASGTDVLAEILKTRKQSRAEWFATADLNVPTYRLMAASDGVMTYRLFNAVHAAALKTLTEGHPFAKWGLNGADSLDLIEREQIINRSLLRRQCKGFLVDMDFVDQFAERYAEENEADAAYLTQEGISPTDSGSMARWLDTNGLLPGSYPRTPKTKQPSGSAQDLESLNHEMVKVFLRHKGRDKVYSNYLTKLRESVDGEGRIRPGTNVLAATTGRMSISGDAPLQQYPAAARGVILADPGDSLVSIDWSQIEPVVAANVAGDTAAIEHYEAGNKFYDVLVDFGGLDYAIAKKSLLAQLYGEGITKLSRDLAVSMDEAKKIVQKIWEILPKTGSLCHSRNGKLADMAQKYGKIMTISGRIVPVPSNVWQGQNQVMAYKGVNYFVQGSAYDVLAESLKEIEARGLGDAVYLAFHDELVVSREAAREIQLIMQTPPQRLIEMSKRTPILRTSYTELGERWGK